LYKLSRRYTLVLSAVVGALAGLMAVVFKLLVEATESYRHTACLALWKGHHVGGLIIIILCGAGLGALAAWITRRFCPEAGGSGIPHVKAVLVTGRPLRVGRLIAVKMGAGLLALGAGMSLGREGPTVHIGSAVAAGFARLARLPARTGRSLIAAGAGAGLAAAFNAPLAGFLFIMEELRRDLSRGTYGNALITAVASVGVTRMCLGYGSAFSVADFAPLHLSTIPAIVIVGLLAALVGVAFNSSLLVTTKRPRYRVWKGALAGALGSVLALTLPQVTGDGNSLTLALLIGDEPANRVWSHLLLLLVLKLIFTVLCYATGVPGGFFAPLLTMGAILGSLTSVLLGGLMPEITPSPERLATIGMAAVLTAAVRAPLTGVVLIVEMTGQYHSLFSLLLAAFVANVAAEALGSEPIYEALLERDLQKGSQQDEAGVLELMVEPGSALDGSSVGKLSLPEDLLIAMIERSGTALIPHGRSRILAGDLLTVVAGADCDESDIAHLLDSARSP
jgi:CIC family chloride channel protein